MKALFLGTLAASQAQPIIEFIAADVRTEILDTNEPAQAAAAIADADVLLTGACEADFRRRRSCGCCRCRLPEQTASMSLRCQVA